MQVRVAIRVDEIQYYVVAIPNDVEDEYTFCLDHQNEIAGMLAPDDIEMGFKIEGPQEADLMASEMVGIDYDIRPSWEREYQ